LIERLGKFYRLDISFVTSHFFYTPFPPFICNSMLKFSFLVSLLILIPSLGSAQTKADHEMYVCADLDLGGGIKWVTVNGIFRRDGVNQYTTITRDTPGICDVTFDPKDHSHFYAASINGPLATYNAARSWRMGADWTMTESRSIHVDSGSDDHIYVGLPDGFAVSDNKGRSWIRKETGLPLRGKYTQVVSVDSEHAGRVLIGTESGIYLTENTASTWKRVFATQAMVTDIEQSPLDHSLWLATSKKDGVLVSHDNGNTWEKMKSQVTHALFNIALDSENPNRFAICGFYEGVLTTEDVGKTWTVRNAGLPPHYEVMRIAIDPDTHVLYAALNRDCIYSSSDFGRNWKKDGLIHSIVYQFVFVPRETK